MSTTRTTRVRHKQHEFDTSATEATRVRYEYETNDTSPTPVKIFDNEASGKIFSHPYISYIANAFEKCTTKTELCHG